MSREKEKFHTLLRLPGNRANDLLAAPRTTELLLFGVHHNRRVTIEVKSLLLELADELDTPSCWLAARSISDQAVDPVRDKPRPSGRGRIARRRSRPFGYD